jgi:uncharacterized sulfatase
VPLIVRAPGFAPGVSDRVVELLDIYPTVLELAGLPPAPHAEGRSLVPLLRQPDLDWPHPAFSQLPKQDRLPGGARITEEMRGRSVHKDRWHFVAWNGGEEGLFDLESDPYQMRNLAAEPGHAATLAAMKKLLKDSGRGGEPSEKNP